MFLIIKKIHLYFFLLGEWEMYNIYNTNKAYVKKNNYIKKNQELND